MKVDKNILIGLLIITVVGAGVFLFRANEPIIACRIIERLAIVLSILILLATGVTLIIDNKEGQMNAIISFGSIKIESPNMPIGISLIVLSGVIAYAILSSSVTLETKTEKDGTYTNTRKFNSAADKINAFIADVDRLNPNVNTFSADLDKVKKQIPEIQTLLIEGK